MDRGAWWAALHGVTQSQTWVRWLSMHACIGEENGTPLQYSCLEYPRDGGAWWATIYGVAQSRTRLKWLSSSSIFILVYESFFTIVSLRMVCRKQNLSALPVELEGKDRGNQIPFNSSWVYSCARLCRTLCDSLDCSPPGSSVHGILQARVLQWVAFFFSGEASPPRGSTHVSCVACIGRWVLYYCSTGEAPSWI